MMKNTLLALAISTASFGAMAELAPMTDGDLSNATGQSGLIVGIDMGTVDKTAGLLNVDYANAGFTMEAFKWEVDAQSKTADGEIAGGVVLVDDGSGNMIQTPVALTDTGIYTAADGSTYGVGDLVATANGGIAVTDISIGGGVDLIVDAVKDGGVNGTIDGLGISFANSDINIRLGSVSTYSAVEAATQGAAYTGHSMGSFELIGMNLDGVSITISGADATTMTQLTQ